MTDGQQQDQPAVALAAIKIRSLSVEIRSAAAWVAGIGALVALPFGYLDAKAACAAILFAAALGASTVQPKR
jgi:hypothetical protein